MVSKITLVLVSTVTVGAGGAASIEFTGIAGTATDLLLVCSLMNTTTSFGDVNFTFNNDTGANYASRILRGNGASVSSYTDSGIAASALGGTNASTNVPSNFSVYIPNYASSTAKSVSIDGVAEANQTTAYQVINAARWTGTAAINRITFSPSSANFAQYSTASLYTILKGSGGASVS
jgi:hypothetical protein